MNRNPDELAELGINVCDHCQLEFESCYSFRSQVTFGCESPFGKPTDDNVIQCACFTPIPSKDKPKYNLCDTCYYINTTECIRLTLDELEVQGNRNIIAQCPKYTVEIKEPIRTQVIIHR